MANSTGSISYGPYGTMTFTDGQNYRVTISATADFRAFDQSNSDFHNYTKNLKFTLTPHLIGF